MKSRSATSADTAKSALNSRTTSALALSGFYQLPNARSRCIQLIDTIGLQVDEHRTLTHGAGNDIRVRAKVCAHRSGQEDVSEGIG